MNHIGAVQTKRYRRQYHLTHNYMTLFNRIFTLAGLICTAGAHLAQGQANDWIIAPDKHMHFTDCCNFVSTLPGSSGITFCGAGPTYRWDQYAGVVSDANGNGMAFVNACGTYDPNTGASIGSNTSPYTFAIPGACNQYYSLTWNTVGSGSFRHQELFFRRLDASNPAAITETSATSVYSSNNSTPIAIAPLAADGSRKVYFSNDLYQMVSITVAANGSIGSASVLTTLPARISDMEVSPNGKKVVINHGNYVTLYDVITLTETALGGSFPGTTVISGIEYVPGTASGDRVYISYHQLASALSFNMEGLGYVNLSAPTVLNDALTGMPGTLSKNGFGFTDIERGKNGYLYFGYHSGYASHWLTNGTVGTMYSTYPDVPSFFVPVSPSTSVSTIDQNNGGFIIQKQIDGEVYRNYTLSVPTFTVNGKSQTPANIPEVLLCNNDLIWLYTTETGYYTGYGVSIRKGTVVGNSFQPGPGGTSIGTIPASRVHDTINLSTLFSAELNGYSGGLEITYVVYNGCGSQSYTQVVNVKRASTVADYLAAKTSRTLAISGKTIQKTLPITVPMPTAANINDFRDSLGAKIGWQGASSAGIYNLNANGKFTLSVYEVMLKLDTISLPGGGTRVDTSIIRAIIGGDTAPDVFYMADSGNISGYVSFNSRTLQFGMPGDPNINPNFLYDTTISNQAGATFYFKEYYNYAKLTGTLNDYNKKTWCVEFTVITPEGCLAKNISYFRIATSTTLPLVGNASMPFSLEGAEAEGAVRLFPNPTSDKIRIKFLTQPKSASIALYDMYGREVLSQAAITPGNATLDLKALPAGMYSYRLIADGQAYQGKIVKR